MTFRQMKCENMPSMWLENVECWIKFENKENLIFSAGETLKGTIHVKVIEPMIIRSKINIIEV